MDFVDVFTEKEAESLLRKSMLEYDFGHFSFKPRLIFKNYSSSIQVGCIDFQTEENLLGVYRRYVNDATPASINANATYKAFITGVVTNYSVSLNHRSNYYIDLQTIARYPYLGLDNTVTASKLKSTKLYQAIVTLMVALTHYDSLVPHLKWAVSDDTSTVPFKDIIDQTALATQVSRGDTITAPMMCQNDGISTPTALVQIREFDSELKRLFTASSLVDYKKVIKHIFTEYLVFGAEIINRIETIKDNDIKSILYSMFTTSQNDISKLLYFEDGSGNIAPSPGMWDIVHELDMEKRYNLIKEFVKVHDTDLDKAVTEYNASDRCVNEMFAEFIKFCQSESILHIRKKSIIILYTELKKRDLLNKLSEQYGGLPLPGIVGSGTGDDGEDGEDENTSMMNDMYIDYGDTDFESERESKKKHSEGGVAFEELDKLSANFEANDYAFEVRTKSDVSEESRNSYLDIANDMSLLNSNLIRSIKEIKVYNTGGKNPGKRTGKLDRKNLYKYKTSKDIFFDNTYKVKESDLAFGIILDVSGSMSGNGIKYGRATMIVLHETLKALNINHSIITHTSRRHHHCIIDRYQSFKEDKTYSCNKNYALAHITAHSGNCDSASLYYMEQCMRRVKNKDKICIIFSDGEPTECSDTELIEQVRHMERVGIRVIGVGINYPKIKEYYKNNANGKNLKEMFNIVSDILKQYVLEKVDKE